MPADLRKFVFFLGLIVLFGGFAMSAPGETDAAAPDYAKASSWVCRPGSEAVCTTGLDRKAFFPDGRTELRPFQPAADPTIDCFYVYPTVSTEDREYADLADSPEIQKVVKAHAGMLSTRCRVFAPLYRQSTLRQLREHLSGQEVPDSPMPYQDVAAAWDHYLQHDNHGRGVVLIGHSQGTILLQRLLVAAIDGKPAQALLVAAFLAGDPSLGVPPGKRVGGTLHHIPVCQAAEETGCAYAWASYPASEHPDYYVFGEPRGDGLESACANPAAPHGGDGLLRSILPRPPAAPETDPPFIETVDQLSGVCTAVKGAHVFEVSVKPGRYADVDAATWTATLQRAVHRPAWGLHPLDLGLVEGNILETIDAETASWGKVHGK